MERLTWQDFMARADWIAGRLATMHVPVDVLVGVARGGLPLLTAVASRLEIADVGVALVRSTLSDAPHAERSNTVECKGLTVSVDLRDRQVVIVDDIIRSGRTVGAVVDALKAHGPRGVTAVALYAEGRPLAVDYVHSAPVRPDQWVLFPWDDWADR